MSSVFRLTDSQKLDKLLAGFDTLQGQYETIKQDHVLLLQECRELRAENQRLREALHLMSANSGKDLQQCEVLLREIEELKDTVAQGHDLLERYKLSLEQKNAQIAEAIESLKKEKAKKCTCLTCRFLAWFTTRRN